MAAIGSIPCQGGFTDVWLLENFQVKNKNKLKTSLFLFL